MPTLLYTLHAVVAKALSCRIYVRNGIRTGFL